MLTGSKYGRTTIEFALREVITPVIGVNDSGVDWSITLSAPLLSRTTSNEIESMSIEVRWKGEGGKIMADLLGDRTSDDGDLILEVTSNAVLNCNPGELAELILALSDRDFDMAELSDLSSVAVLHRRKKAGRPSLLVKPAPFIRSPLMVKKLESSSSRALIKRQKGSSINSILAAAFAFFIIVVLGYLFYKSRSVRSGRSRR